MSKDEKIIDYVKETLKNKALNEEQLLGTSKISHLIDIVHDEDEDTAICLENTLCEYFYDIARMYYDKGFKDGKGLVKECLSD